MEKRQDKEAWKHNAHPYIVLSFQKEKGKYSEKIKSQRLHSSSKDHGDNKNHADKDSKP